MKISLPNQGFIFWNVGTGDSTTMLVTDEVVMQVDLNHLEVADNNDDHRTPIIDELVRLLPKVQGKPFLSVFVLIRFRSYPFSFLSVFVLTHLDQDHCRGFAELLKRVTIGELWFTPRIFRDCKDDDTVLCDDAEAFHKEAKRRVKLAIEQSADLPIDGE